MLISPELSPDIPTGLVELRRNGAAVFSSLLPPTATDEQWRYTTIDALNLDDYRLNQVPPSSIASRGAFDNLFTTLDVSVDLPSGLVKVVHRLIPQDPNRRIIVLTINGWLAHVAYIGDAHDDGVAVQSGRSADIVSENPTALQQNDYFVALHQVLAPEPIVVTIERHGDVLPVQIVHWIDDDHAAAFPWVEVNVEANAAAMVSEYVATPADLDALVVSRTHLRVGENATCTYAGVQDASTSTTILATVQSDVGKGASLRSIATALGGKYARLVTDCRMQGPSSSAKLEALYFGSGDQLHDFRTYQDHRARSTSSDLLFKGAVGDAARSVYSGLIRVEKGASGTTAFQTNRNLVLSPQAHADSVPNLEIEENDVSCSHASAVGPVDEDQLFFLESRGVPSDVASRLIVLGFLSELLEDIPHTSWRDLVRARIVSKFDALVDEPGRTKEAL